MSAPDVSVVIPAYNEADYLPQYLPTVFKSLQLWEETSGKRGEVIVVDNASIDATAQVATGMGAVVVRERRRNIGQVRNTGAAAALGRFLFFVDADVALPAEAISAAVGLLSSSRCVGGAIPPRYTPKRWGARLLCWYWDAYRRRIRGAQGVAQFCTAEAFATLSGYRTDLFMSEDVEFFSRLRDLGDRRGEPVVLVDDLRVEPSTRRYDQWPTWRMWWWQNPVTARLRLRSASFWRHWYETTVR
ncbi:glycosyltransferase [Streptomyces sp. PSKA54]|uniref:4,4'-diaponeurosporenoate glycosyltransferase n=1 Tax=Streptomyces himalayensis subsp. aureolus TaxID=2758039 RepID=A0A7W2HK92_9ACTN|nr:glycosyltransferase [Streptomyces himalayensis]MBA4866942.1 glycosyltransferase [Streptomyces himalayensis subsp. aureolus]